MPNTIRHMTFIEVEESAVHERTQLAKQAANLLGYRKLAEALVIPEALLFTLRDLEIEPLRQSEVQSYKRKKARPGMWSGHKQAVVMGVLTALCGGILIPWLNQKAGNWDGPTTAALGCIAACAMAIVLAIRCLMLFFDGGMRGHRIAREWVYETLGSYDGNVPEFVLAKAIAIKAACPGVEFKVERLYEKEERIQRATRDPFLIAELGRERYYIEVWDEKEYESRL